VADNRNFIFIKFAPPIDFFKRKKEKLSRVLEIRKKGEKMAFVSLKWLFQGFLNS